MASDLKLNQVMTASQRGPNVHLMGLDHAQAPSVLPHLRWASCRCILAISTTVADWKPERVDAAPDAHTPSGHHHLVAIWGST